MSVCEMDASRLRPGHPPPNFLCLFPATEEHRQLFLYELPGGRINDCFVSCFFFLLFSLFAIVYYIFNTFKYAFCFYQTCLSSTLTHPSCEEEHWAQLSVLRDMTKFLFLMHHGSVVRSFKAPCGLNPCL
jgi:hypothetical protein